MKYAHTRLNSTACELHLMSTSSFHPRAKLNNPLRASEAFSGGNVSTPDKGKASSQHLEHPQLVENSTNSPAPTKNLLIHSPHCPKWGCLTEFIQDGCSRKHSNLQKRSRGALIYIRLVLNTDRNSNMKRPKYAQKLTPEERGELERMAENSQNWTRRDSESQHSHSTRTETRKADYSTCLSQQPSPPQSRENEIKRYKPTKKKRKRNNSQEMSAVTWKLDGGRETCGNRSSPAGRAEVPGTGRRRTREGSQRG